MGQFRQVLLAIDSAHTVPQRALNCRPGNNNKKHFFIKQFNIPFLVLFLVNRLV